MSKQEEKIIDQRIGAWVRETRRAHGYTMKEVAALLNVTYQQVQKYEKGTNRLSVTRLIAFTAAIGIGPEMLFIRLQDRDHTSEYDRDGYRAATIARRIEDRQSLTQWLAQGRRLARSLP